MNYLATLVVFCFIGVAFCGETKTACQEHRERELKSTVLAKLVPECDENGDYKPIACYNESVGGKRFCTCFTKNGDIAKSPSQNVKKCECYVSQHEATNPPRIGAFKPACEADGTYSKKQCHGSTGMCWCSHPDGNKKTEPTRGTLTCE
ncbi:putative neurotoxin LTDF S-18-like protein [Leptotrombidium deliense]|uniref:Putative neurotoxin LTDF S-18-like protein n=1 Tax=Leptotrombidium deliense TaxID=299467 RepID=A0A443SN22_9ACAR|nr:putative neurotoxin LTDF S-18-like protein [Leptotrombidium deliense]